MKALNALAQAGKPSTNSMPTRFQVSRQDDSAESGWIPIGKFGSLSKAEAFAAHQERGKYLYSNNNPNRQYHLIESV